MTDLQERDPVTGVIESLTDVQPGHLRFRECLLIVLNEEWEHRLSTERDRTIIEEKG